MAWTNIRDRALRERAVQVIPNGMYGHESTVLLPSEYPQFFSNAKGSRLWDVDGNEYVDFMCAFGPNLLGYGHEPVERAAAAQQARGDVLTGPSEVMVELAEALVQQVDHAAWAMFCKNGTDATSLAIVAARAQTGKRKILYATGAYHGAAAWCTPRPAGILPEDRAHLVYYQYNDLDSLADAMRAHAGDIAGVIATPFLHEVFRDQADPQEAFAKGARALCDEHEAMLILDEVRAGFRLARGSSWEQFGVKPDLSAWGKVLANGHSLSAVLGSESARKGASEIFVTGSFWFGATAMAAGLATLREIRATDYLERTIETGSRLRAGLDQQAASHGFAMRQTGPAQMPQIFFENDPDFRIGYAWCAEALKRGAYLHPYHNMFLSGAHTTADIDATLQATDAAFEEVKKRSNSLEPHPVLMQLLSH
jgi:glutamate-1-semialdehyde 2,1-aminomutase